MDPDIVKAILQNFFFFLKKKNLTLRILVETLGWRFLAILPLKSLAIRTTKAIELICMGSICASKFGATHLPILAGGLYKALSHLLSRVLAIGRTYCCPDRDLETPKEKKGKNIHQLI
jgi:hypothetical protein